MTSSMAAVTFHDLVDADPAAEINLLTYADLRRLRGEASLPHGGDYDGKHTSDGVDRPLPAEPLTTYVCLYLPEDEYLGPYWRFDFAAAVKQEIEDNSNPTTGKIDGPHPGLLRIRDALRELADLIDAAHQKEGLTP